jgi:hypothetical protein
LAFQPYFKRLAFKGQVLDPNQTFHKLCCKVIEQPATPIRRSNYGIAIWERFVVIFGGYGALCLGLQKYDCLVLGRNCVNRRDPISTGGHDPFTAGMFCEPRDEAFYLGDTWHHDMDVCPQGCADIQGGQHTSTSAHRCIAITT